MKETHKQNLQHNICKQNLDIKLIKKLLMKDKNKHEIFQDQSVEEKRAIVCQNSMSHKKKKNVTWFDDCGPISLLVMQHHEQICAIG